MALCVALEVHFGAFFNELKQSWAADYQFILALSGCLL